MDAALDALMHDEYSSGEYRLKLKSVPVCCLSVVVRHAHARQRWCTAWLSGFPVPLLRWAACAAARPRGDNCDATSVWVCTDGGLCWGGGGHVDVMGRADLAAG